MGIRLADFADDSYTCLNDRRINRTSRTESGGKNSSAGIIRKTRRKPKSRTSNNGHARRTTRGDVSDAVTDAGIQNAYRQRGC